jgi:hypothetical protein
MALMAAISAIKQHVIPGYRGMAAGKQGSHTRWFSAIRLCFGDVWSDPASNVKTALAGRLIESYPVIKLPV